MNRLVASSLAMALLAATGSALAQDRYADDYGPEPAYGQGYGSGAESDVAAVVSVDPIVERSQPTLRQECWSEPVRHAQAGRYDDRYDDRYARRSSGGGAILGAIVGGFIGHELADNDRHGRHGRRYGGYHYGRGRNNDREAVATVAGALVGASIGAGIERSNGYARDGGYAMTSTREVQHCRTVQVEDGYDSGEGRVSGYRVTYEYAGRRYETVTDYHPGSEMRVRVEVMPER